MTMMLKNGAYYNGHAAAIHHQDGEEMQEWKTKLLASMIRGGLDDEDDGQQWRIRQRQR